MKKKLKIEPVQLQSINELDHLIIKGAREHNLKNIDLEIPKKKFVVITGVSGSGKSSLALDTIFAEGQRRYVESLSSYARQFLGQLEKPKFDMIRGLSPTISIEQKAASKNPRSTVGTITEIYDYLRVLFARIGTQHCHKCGKKVGRGDAATMVEQILTMPISTKILLLAPLVENRKGEHKEQFEDLRRAGFVRVRIDGVVRDLSDVQSLSKHKKHNIEVVVDRLVIKADSSFKKRLIDSVEASLKIGKGSIIIHVEDREDIKMSEARACCNFAFPSLDPPLFSFNAPLGMCPTCNGLGVVLAMDEDKMVPDKSLTIREGAIVPWKSYFQDGEENDHSWGAARLKAMSKKWGLPFDTPWQKIEKKKRDIILYGFKGKDLTVKWKRDWGEGTYNFEWEGLTNAFMRRYRQTGSELAKEYYGKFLTQLACTSCEGKRLKPEVLAVKINNKSIVDVSALTITGAKEFLKNLQLNANQHLIADELLKEIIARLDFLINVGLDYLTLDRSGPTLSGGEAQRIRLASQIGSELTGVLYILDEPSIGLHQKDNLKLLNTFKHLRDIGNSLLVIEHDKETMESSDWIVDLGPGAGRLGGQVVFSGTPEDITKYPASLTGQYLSGKRKIEVPVQRRSLSKDFSRWINIVGARENNLANIDVDIPIGLFTCITGVSGAGKSTLVNQILFPAISRRLHDSSYDVGAHDKILGLEFIDKIINIDQRPIGRTPRSNPATYTKVFDQIRDFFALLPETRARGYKKGRFSFNVKGGRCEQCQGDGYIKVEMHFLADVFVPCEVCSGKRFNEATLEIKYKGCSIADVLDMSVSEARELFSKHPAITRILDTLLEVGLSYIKLGQPATTLSGGEAQRVKLSRELAKKDTGRTLYILDEPTTGLHFDDIKKLLLVLKKLVDAGNTVVVIEHNLDVIKTADWIIDLGPDGGVNGGRIVATGSPEKLATIKSSYTGMFLQKILSAQLEAIPTNLP